MNKNKNIILKFQSIEWVLINERYLFKLFIRMAFLCKWFTVNPISLLDVTRWQAQRMMAWDVMLPLRLIWYSICLSIGPDGMEIGPKQVVEERRTVVDSSAYRNAKRREFVIWLKWLCLLSIWNKNENKYTKRKPFQFWWEFEMTRQVTHVYIVSAASSLPSFTATPTPSPTPST